MTPEQTFEYEIVDLQGKDPRNLAAALNAYGHHSWQLSNVTYLSNDITRLILQRTITAATPSSH